MLLYTPTRGDLYDLKVNDDQTLTDQSNPRIAVSKGGNFAVVWTDKRHSQIDIYFQLYDSAGVALASNEKLNDTTLDIPQFEPAIDANFSSQYITVWRDYRNGAYPFDPDIYFSRIDTAQTPENINVTGENTVVARESPDIAMFADGSSIVVWSDYRNGNWDIFARRLNTSGLPTGSSFKVNTDVGTTQQHSPRVAAFSDGGFVVTWYDNRLGHDDIFFQRFDPSGNPVNLNIKANDDVGTTKQAFPAVAADGNMRFFIAWVDWRNGSYPANPDIYFRRFDSSGLPLENSLKVNGADMGRAQREVSLAADRMGNVCVVWADSVDGQWDAMAQMIDYSGTRDGNNFAIHTETGGKQLQPDVAADGYKFYFTWADYRDGHFDIYAAIRQYNNPSLIPDPTTLEFTMEAGGAIPDSQLVVLTNAGIGELDWRARATVDWLTVSPDSGLTPDSFHVSITVDTLDHGSYFGDIVLVDLDNGDSTEVVNVTLTISSDDQVRFLNASAMPSGIGVMPLRINLVNPAKGACIPIGYDHTAATLDSINVNTSLMPGCVGYHTAVDPSGRGELGFYIDSAYLADSLIPAGDYDLAYLFFTAGDTDAVCTVDTLSDTSSVYILDSTLSKIVPTVIAGDLVIGSATDVDDDELTVLPESIELGQNYPNPFNSVTEFTVSLPRASQIRIDIYNILGQKVHALYDGFLDGGEHIFSWDGSLSDGTSAPTGVFFYSLTADNFRSVRKMVLLK